MSASKQKKKDLLVEKSVVGRWGKLSGQTKQTENYLQQFQEEEDPVEDELPTEDPEMAGDELGGPAPMDDSGMGTETAEVSLSDEQVEALIQVLQAVTNAQSPSDESDMSMDDDLGGMDDDLGGMDDDLDDMDDDLDGMDDDLNENRDEELEDEVADRLAESVIKKMKKNRKMKSRLERLDLNEVVKNVSRRLEKQGQKTKNEKKKR